MRLSSLSEALDNEVRLIDTTSLTLYQAASAQRDIQNFLNLERLFRGFKSQKRIEASG